jgi:hypothetical protein
LPWIFNFGAGRGFGPVLGLTVGLVLGLVTVIVGVDSSLSILSSLSSGWDDGSWVSVVGASENGGVSSKAILVSWLGDIGVARHRSLTGCRYVEGLRGCTV